MLNRDTEGSGLTSLMAQLPVQSSIILIAISILGVLLPTKKDCEEGACKKMP